MGVIGQTSTPLLAASSTSSLPRGGTIASAVAAITQLIGTAWPAHLSMQQCRIRNWYAIGVVRLSIAACL